MSLNLLAVLFQTKKVLFWLTAKCPRLKKYKQRACPPNCTVCV